MRNSLRYAPSAEMPAQSCLLPQILNNNNRLFYFLQTKAAALKVFCAPNSAWYFCDRLIAPRFFSTRFFRLKLPRLKI